MAGIGKFKLSDALPKTPGSVSKAKPGEMIKGKASEQIRGTQELQKTRNTGGNSRRERMIDIGRGGQQAGRQGGSS